MALSPQEQEQYFNEQGTSATPLSPTAYEATLRGGGQTITAESLAPAEAPAFETPEPTYVPDLSYLGALGKTAELSPEEESAQSLSDRMLELTKPLAGKDQYQMEQEQASGLPGFQAQERDLQARLTGYVNESRAIPLQIQQEFAGRGATAGGVAPIQTARIRENAIKALTVKSLLEATRGSIASAKDNADRAVALKFAPMEAEMKALEKNLEIIQKSPAYTQAEKKRALEQSLILEERKTAQAQKKEDESAILAMATAAVANNPGNQQAQMAAQKALATGDLKKAFSILGQYQDDPMELRSQILDEEYKRQQIESVKAAIRKTNADATATKEQKNVASSMAKLDPDSPTFTLDMVRASAGGKTPTGEQTKPINKASLVLSQLADLQKNVSEASTGPILGILRDNNPYDVKAQLIRAQLQAITPNLARGVYGEVGVLTDNDIKNYIQTLPNLKKPEEANKLILAMTLKVVKNSVDSNLQVLAAEGRDVSGFEPILANFNRKIAELENVTSKTTKMVGPDGKSYNVPSEQVDAFIKAGGKKQ